MDLSLCTTNWFTCFDVTGWSVDEILEQHDADKSGCLNYCEFHFFYQCNAQQQGWPIPTNTNMVAEKLFTEFDTGTPPDECCLNLGELKYMLKSVGALRPEIIIENGPISEIEVVQPRMLGI